MPAVGGSGSGGSVTAGRAGGGADGTGVGSGVAVGSAWAVGAGVACSPRTTAARATSRTRSGLISTDTTAAVGNACATDIDRASPPDEGRRNGRRPRTTNANTPALASAPRNMGATFAGPIPQCVDFVNTASPNKQFVRELGRPAALAFSRYEIVTSRKRALCRRGDHHEPRILAVRSRRGLKRESLVIGRLDPARVGGRDARVKLRDYKFEFTTARRRDRDLVADARVPE